MICISYNISSFLWLGARRNIKYIIYVCLCLYCVICLKLYYRSLLICTNKEFKNKYNINITVNTTEILINTLE